MSMQKQKVISLRKFLRILLLVLLCAINVSQSAEQEAQNPEEEIEQIEAELSSLREELAAIESNEPGAVPFEPEPVIKEVPVPDFLRMTPEELTEMEVETSASLTKTSPRLTPYTLTTITKKDIRTSQARSLYELLEMYVPNLQMMFTSHHPKTLGLRGILAHRSNKFLLLVNGRVMNEKTDYGVMMEVDLPMLTDIHHIEVIRGPSSALYGPSALAMTISIITDNADTYQGEEVTVRGGAIEQYATVEYKTGRQLKDDSGVFFYAGVSQYNGADPEDSPTVFGSENPVSLRSGHYPNYEWKSYQSGDKVRDWFKNLNEMPFDKPKMKMFAEYTKGGFDIWARYTEGGQWIDFTQWTSTGGVGATRESSDDGLSYTQATVQASYDHQISSDLSMEYTASYDRFTNENENYDRAFYWKSFAEEKFYGKALARWTPHEDHSLAFGGEWAHEEFGKSMEDLPISIPGFGPEQVWGFLIVPRWRIDRQAILGEYQWNINKQFTMFLSGRIDWYPYTETMYSPRGVLVYTPTKRDTFKFMASRSSNTGSAGQRWRDHYWGDMDSPVEELDAFELRYERQHNKNLWFAGSVFFYDFSDALAELPDEGVDTGSATSTVLGDTKSWGFELEAGYRKGKLELDVSHSFTKLLDMSNPSGDTWNQYSVEPFGFSDDYAQWHNQTSKIRAKYQLTDRLSLNGALCILWGNPGGKDWAEYRDYLYPDYDYDAGYEEPFEASAYLNLGAEYKWGKNTTINVTGYNLLGLFDEDLNKRRVGFDDQIPGHYRIQPAAIGASLTHKF